ncbi:hypothetical protein CR513_25210, partial [Mucuna pruriens]
MVHCSPMSECAKLLRVTRLISFTWVILPFDDFAANVLRILGVAPSQIHPNSWAAMQAFRVICRALAILGWISLIPFPKRSLFTPFVASYKGFKECFVYIKSVAGTSFASDSEPLPLYWKYPSEFKGIKKGSTSRLISAGFLDQQGVDICFLLKKARKGRKQTSVGDLPPETAEQTTPNTLPFPSDLGKQKLVAIEKESRKKGKALMPPVLDAAFVASSLIPHVGEGPTNNSTHIPITPALPITISPPPSPPVINSPPVAPNPSPTPDSPFEHKELKAKVLNLETALEASKVDSTSAKSAISKLQAELSSNKEEASGLKVVVSSLEGENAKLKSQVSSLESENTKLVSEVLGLETASIVWETKVSELKTEYAELKKNSNTLAESLSTPEAQLKSLKEIHQTDKVEVAKLEDCLKEAKLTQESLEALVVNEHQGGFDKALRQVALLFPGLDLSKCNMYQDVVDGQLVVYSDSEE